MSGVWTVSKSKRKASKTILHVSPAAAQTAKIATHLILMAMVVVDQWWWCCGGATTTSTILGFFWNQPEKFDTCTA